MAPDGAERGMLVARIAAVKAARNAMHAARRRPGDARNLR